MLVRGIDWTGGLEDAWSSVADFIPKLAIFAVVLLVGWLVAKVIAKIVGEILTRVGFTRVLERAGADRFAQIDPIGLITKLVYYFILLIALQLALSAFGPTNPVSQIVNDIVNWLPQAFVAVVIVIVVLAIANAVRDILTASLSGQPYGPLLTKVITGFIIALGIIAALNQIGVGLTVTMPVLIAVLATVGGILVVGVGGALISVVRPHLDRWVSDLNRSSTPPNTPGTGGGSSTINF